MADRNNCQGASRRSPGLIAESSGQKNPLSIKFFAASTIYYIVRIASNYFKQHTLFRLALYFQNGKLSISN
jgi:hypothetical protein